MDLQILFGPLRLQWDRKIYYIYKVIVVISIFLLLCCISVKKSQNKIQHFCLLYICCRMENLTMDYMNETTTPPEVDMFPNIYRTVAGSCIFILVLPFVLFHFKFFPVRTTMAVLLGAMLMVTFNVITQSEVYEIIGKRYNLTTIFLLLGMALIAEYFEREQLVGKLLRIFLKSEQHFINYLVRVCVFSFVLSMIFTNDGCCLLLTPVLLRCWEEQERSRNELETLLLGVATSANIGSVTTVFGNAVLALISARTYSKEIGNFSVDLLTCFQYLLPPAIVCFWINFVFLCGHYRIKSRRCGSARCLSERQSTEQELSGLTRNSHHLDLAGTNGYLKQEQDDYCNGYGFREERLAHPPTLETILEDEILELPEASTWIVDSSPSHNVQESSFASGDTQVEEESDGLTGMRSCTATEDLTCIDEEFTAQSSPTNSQPSNPAASGNLSRLMDQEGLSPSSQSGIYRSLSGISTADFLSTRFQRYDQETMGGSRILQASIVLVILAIFSLLLVSTDLVTFDIGEIDFLWT